MERAWSWTAVPLRTTWYVQFAPRADFPSPRRTGIIRSLSYIQFILTLISSHSHSGAVSPAMCHLQYAMCPSASSCRTNTYSERGSGPKCRAWVSGLQLSVLGLRPVAHRDLVNLLLTVPLRALFLFVFSVNTFIEIQLTCNTIHPFKVYDSVVFSIFIELCNDYHNFRTFSPLQKETLYPLSPTNSLDLC